MSAWSTSLGYSYSVWYSSFSNTATRCEQTDWFLMKITSRPSVLCKLKKNACKNCMLKGNSYNITFVLENDSSIMRVHIFTRFVLRYLAFILVNNYYFLNLFQNITTRYNMSFHLHIAIAVLSCDRIFSLGLIYLHSKTNWWYHWTYTQSTCSDTYHAVYSECLTVSCVILS